MLFVAVRELIWRKYFTTYQQVNYSIFHNQQVQATVRNNLQSDKLRLAAMGAADRRPVRNQPAHDRHHLSCLRPLQRQWIR